MKSFFLIILSIGLLALTSCKDKCEDMEVGTICGTPFTFDILGEADTNVFKNVYDIESFQIVDSLNQPIEVDKNPFRKLIAFQFFNCELEEDRFDQINYKVFYFQYGTSQIDEFKVAFKPVKARSSCGGTQYEYLKFYFRGNIYDAREQSITYKLKR